MSLSQQLTRKESVRTSHRDAMRTAILRAGAWQGVVSLPPRQPGAYSAQVVEAVEAKEVSDDELETEYQEAMAVPTVVEQQSRETSVLCRQGQARQARAETFLCARGDRWAIGKTVTSAWPK